MKKLASFITLICLCILFSVSVRAEELPAIEETTAEVSAPEAPTKEQATIEIPTTQEPTKEEPSTTQPPTIQPPTIQPPTTKPKETPKWGELDGKFYNDKGQVIEGAIAKGIDVSHHQGKIDWKKVSQTDIEFAIIRCGYGSDIKSQDDAYFKQNIEGCEKYGIPYGIYIYSYATNTTMAKSEAQHVLRLIKSVNAKPTYPVYYDMEDSIQWSLSKNTLADIAETFCETMLQAGYRTGVYANLNWWNNKLTDKRFNSWDRWVAQYNSTCAYKGTYEMWQFTSVGRVDGIGGDIDVNILYYHDCTKKGHIYSAWKVTKKATCSKSGTKIRTCYYCGKTETATIKATDHKYKWVVTKKATVFKKGKQSYKCTDCGKVKSTKSIAKLKPTGKLNKTSITLKVKKKYKKLKVKNLANGDSVKSYKSSNNKIVKVSKKGVITAGKKTGKATITVKLKSGKKLKLSVKVKK